MKKVLIVEDDSNISLALALRLKSEGFGVVVSGDAVYGTMKAVQEHPDVVILDINMPGGNGFDIAERIRSNPDILDTPLIFITANHDNQLKKNATDNYGAFDFFSKPYDAEALLKSVHRAVS